MNNSVIPLVYRLNTKFLLGTAAGLLICSLLFLVLFVWMYQAELERTREYTASNVNRLLQVALENAMLKRDLDGLATIVQRLGEQPEVRGVMIANPSGEVRFADRPERLGVQLWQGVPPQQQATASYLYSPDGEAVLRSINPVANKPACKECHGPVAEKPLNGVLLVDYAAAPIRRQAFYTTLVLMFAGAVVTFATLIGGWWFMRRFVLRPVQELVRASSAISSGDLSARVELSGRDELAQLGHAFNQMAQSTQSSILNLQAGERFLQEMIDTIPDGVRVIDPNGRIVLHNHAYREQLALDEDAVILGEYCWRSSHAADGPCPYPLKTCPLRELRHQSQSLRFLDRHQRANGSTLEVEITVAPITLLRNGNPQRLIVESIRDLESQVRFSHEQKLAELGRLSAGVAHEIHNPLCSVRLALGSLREEREAMAYCPPLVTDYLLLVDREIDACIDITQRLLRLSAVAPSEAELVVLDRAVEETLSLLRWEALQRKIEVRCDYQQRPLRLLAADSEIRMAILNLAQNAFHAMPEGGRLQVDCGREAGWVWCTLQDSGCGIAEEDREQIFYPFFSRRADGSRGIGLGLFIVRSTVTARGGALSLCSRPGEGACFRIAFPDADSNGERADLFSVL